MLRKQAKPLGLALCSTVESSALHCRELCPVTAFQVIRTPKWGDIYLRRPTSSLYHVSTDSSTLTAERMNNLYNNNLHLWFTDQQTKLQHGKQRLLHPQHQGRGAACTARGFSLDSRKTQGNFHKSDKLREKYNVHGDFFLNFIEICKFKRYFNRRLTENVWDLKDFSSDMLVMPSQKRAALFFTAMVTPCSPEEQLMSHIKKSGIPLFFSTTSYHTGWHMSKAATSNVLSDVISISQNDLVWLFMPLTIYFMMCTKVHMSSTPL